MTRPTNKTGDRFELLKEKAIEIAKRGWSYFVFLVFMSGILIFLIWVLIALANLNRGQ